MTPLVDATAAAEIAERFRNRNSSEMPDDCEVGVGAKPRKYRYIRPFSDAAEDLIDICQNTDGRWMFGIQSIDAMTRGLGRGELMYVTGRAHSGKTQLCLQSIANNPNAHVMLFTPDEVDVLVLSKLVSIVRGIDGEQLEHRIRNNDAHTIDIVRRCAADDFRNMIVIDQSLTFDQMTVARDCGGLLGADARRRRWQRQRGRQVSGHEGVGQRQRDSIDLLASGVTVQRCPWHQRWHERHAVWWRDGGHLRAGGLP